MIFDSLYAAKIQYKFGGLVILTSSVYDCAIFPCPKAPKIFAPQPHIDPSALRASIFALPQETKINLSLFFAPTLSKEYLFRVSPSPSCPKALFPEVQRVPS